MKLVKQQTIPKPIGKLSFFKNVMKIMPLHCSYCGQKYVESNDIKTIILIPLPKNAKYCPDGHEGYVYEYFGTEKFKSVFDSMDFLTNQPTLT